MLYEGNHEHPEQIDCSEIIQMGGRVKAGIVEKRELEGDVEIRVSLRSSKILSSVELFTLRNVVPADYRLVLVVMPRNRGNDQSHTNAV